jgi:hypothetical protein
MSGSETDPGSVTNVTTGAPDTRDTQDDDDHAASNLRVLIGRLKAHRAAWAAFCDEIGIDPATVHFAYYADSREIAELFDLEDFGPIEADAEHQAELLEGLRDSRVLRLSRSGT